MKTVAIPMETKVREFHGKMWLGLHLLDRGYKVILGPSDEIINTLHISEPDIYIPKDTGNTGFFKSLHKAGCKVCSLDVEGGVYSTLENYVENRKESIDDQDLYFTWGEAQTEQLKKHTSDPEKIITTGNPRFDLLNRSLRYIYDDKATLHRKKYDDYVLFNMNFAWANHFDPENQVKRQNKAFGGYDLNKFNYISELYNEFITSIHSLQPHEQEFNIVIRPHPSENHETYRRIFRNYDNVFVKYSGDVRSWIAGSAVVVHNSCTTGIESALMDHPVIAFRPVQNKTYDKELPNLVSEEVYNREDLSDRILYYVENDVDYSMNEDQRQELKRYFHNVDTVAAELIAKKIDSLSIDKKKSYDHLKPSIDDQLEWKVRSSRFSGIIIQIHDTIKKVVGDKEVIQRREYNKQKFPALSEDEIQAVIKKLGSQFDLNSVEISLLSSTNDSFALVAK